MPIQTYRDLEAWQKAMDLAEGIYQLTYAFPKEELYGLTSQIRRAAVSVPANIAEGYGRIHRKEYLNHLSIARGSLWEVETLLQLAVRLKYPDQDRARALWPLLQDVGKMLNKLIRVLADPTKTQGKVESPSIPDPGSRIPPPDD